MPATVRKADFGFYYDDKSAAEFLEGEVRVGTDQMVLSIRKGGAALRDYLLVGKVNKDGAFEGRTSPRPGTNDYIDAAWNILSNERYVGIWREDGHEYPFVIELD